MNKIVTLLFELTTSNKFSEFPDLKEFCIEFNSLLVKYNGEESQTIIKAVLPND